jgi:hypothetical protein
MKDQVTASTKPRAASTRRLSLCRPLLHSVSTGFSLRRHHAASASPALCRHRRAQLPPRRDRRAAECLGAMRAGAAFKVLEAVPLSSDAESGGEQSFDLARARDRARLQRSDEALRSNLQGRDSAFGGLPAMARTLLGSPPQHLRARRCRGKARALAPQGGIDAALRTDSARRIGY